MKGNQEGDLGHSGADAPSGSQASPEAGKPSSPSVSIPNATYAIEISFGGVGVEISREAYRKLVDAVDLICAEYEIAHPDRVMWAAGFGAKMLRNPLSLGDDEPIPFDDSVEVIECCERERFDTEKLDRTRTCPFCQHSSRPTMTPEECYCDKHYRLYLLTYNVSPADLDAYRAQAIRRAATAKTGAVEDESAGRRHRPMTIATPPNTDDGWIEWSGGARPVSGETRVVCKLRDGRTMRAARARNRAWDHINDGTDTVAYRIVKPGEGK